MSKAVIQGIKYEKEILKNIMKSNTTNIKQVMNNAGCTDSNDIQIKLKDFQLNIEVKCDKSPDWGQTKIIYCKFKKVWKACKMNNKNKIINKLIETINIFEHSNDINLMNIVSEDEYKNIKSIYKDKYFDVDIQVHVHTHL